MIVFFSGEGKSSQIPYKTWLYSSFNNNNNNNNSNFNRFRPQPDNPDNFNQFSSWESLRSLLFGDECLSYSQFFKYLKNF